MKEIFNEEAERAILGSCLIGLGSTKDLPVDIALDKGCSKDWFYKPRHKHLWDVLLSMHTTGEAVDLLTVGNRLKSDGRLDFMGGYEFLEKLVDSVVSVQHLTYYLEMADLKQKQRRIYEIASSGVDMAGSEDADPEQIVAKLSLELTKLLSKDESKTTDELMDDNLTVVHNAVNGVVSGVELPWKLFSENIGGLQKGSMTPIVGRDGKGKSGAVDQMFDHWAGRNIPALGFFLEDDPRRALLRMAGCREWFSARDYEGGRSSTKGPRTTMIEYEHDKAKIKLNNYREWIRDKPFYYAEKGVNGLTAEMIVAKIRHHHRVNNIEVVIIDGFKDIDFSYPQKGDTENEKHIAKLLAGVVKDLNIAGGVVSHINKIDDDIAITKEKITGSSAQYKGARQVLIFQDSGIAQIADENMFMLSATKANFAHGGSVLLRRDEVVLHYTEVSAGY